jgi:predicted dehydrogenase
MTHELQSDQEMTVVSLGLGKAGMGLHGKVWDSLDGYEVTRIGYDSDRNRREAARAAGLVVVDSLVDLPEAIGDRTLHVVDNATSSGDHAASTRAVLDILDDASIRSRAWLLEKPVVSNADERIVMEGALEEIGPRAFVNENYLASRAIDMGRNMIAEQSERGNDVRSILVHFVKDRVPNVVLDNRFTDPKGLAVYGIEMPHQLAIASALHGTELDTRNQEQGGAIIENTYLRDIDGIEQSEGNITVFEQDGRTITIRQGLGPFDFDEHNGLVRREYDWRSNEAERYALVTFADGRQLKLIFDPVVGAPRYHSQMELYRPDGEIELTETFEDNTLRNLIEAVAAFGVTDGSIRPTLLDQLQPESAMRYFEQLSELRYDAGEPRRIAAERLAGQMSVAKYLADLAAEKALRDKQS